MANIGPQKTALRRAFENGRRAGIWLVKYGPSVQSQNRQRDIGVMRGQDRDLSGVADMFGRAERDARLASIPRPRVARPEPQPEGKYDEEDAPRQKREYGGEDVPPPVRRRQTGGEYVPPVKKRTIFTNTQAAARLEVLKARKAAQQSAF